MKLLIKIDDKGFFGMHDHLRDMGRTIAKKEKEGTRLCETTHLSKIDFFRLGINEGNSQSLQMLYRHDLRYLHLQNVTVKHMAKVSLPQSLIWLRLEDCTFESGKYRAAKKILSAIRKQRHSSCVGDSWQLKIMQLKGCSNMGSLSISSLFSHPCTQLLQHLDLEGCRRLNYLPDGICKLSQLKTLNLGWCEMLKELPSEIGDLSQLQHLDLRGCDGLKNLPISIGTLSELQYLDLEMCFNLKSLPDTIGGLSQLQNLNLGMCMRLTNLPNSIGQMSRLQRLDLEGCASLNKLPGTIGDLLQLQYFAKPPTFKRDTQIIYDVYLSFRGSDVRKTLVVDLFQALSAAGATVFFDLEGLKSEMIWESLERAIKSSAILIPIFSKGYADSACCLREAAAMVNSPGLIIPLFYHMNLTDVRYLEKHSSPYKKSFLNHYWFSDKYSITQIDGWKNALVEICQRSGWSVDGTEGSKAEQLKTIVNELMKVLTRIKDSLKAMKNLVVQKLNLSSEEDVVKVVIWGLGSCIGQTRVAMAVYDRIRADFEVASFVFNVRATGLPNLQTQILKDLNGYDGKVQSVEHGKTLFTGHLAGKRVLLVLDDVYSVEQLDALVGNWVGPGSRIIITSTSKYMLDVARESSECIPVLDKLFVIGKIVTLHK